MLQAAKLRRCRACLFCLLLALPLTLPAAGPLRTFTDARGRTIRAEMVAVRQDQVTLRLENGQVHTLGIMTFGAEDQRWIRAWGGGAAASSGAKTAPGGMAFSPNWLPTTLTARRELLESLDFYCKAAVGNAPKGGETVPATIVGGIRWRMPLDEAVLTLPKGFNKLTERAMVHPCLPLDSLTLCGFQYKSFVDREQPFNQLFLLIDKERKVVSAQFVNQSGRDVRWFPVPDGVREPYYNLVSLTHNGSSGKEVPYQILGGGGVICVKTAFRDRTMQMPGIPNMPPNVPGAPGMLPAGRTHENVHWYLPAPLARAILEIVEVYRRAGVIR